MSSTSKGRHPKTHEVDVWNVADYLFHPSMGLLYSVSVAAEKLGCKRNWLIINTDNLGLTVIRRTHQNNGRYYLISEIDSMARDKKKKWGKVDRKDVIKIADRG